mmetsp:Transcript_37394/g.60541  ORF Transcript_37394/g.60541 Transcript_37394/m.60541 type:complete len:384 (-) Transcript_37394:639-1790(-)|eukprot:CAMPEP_0184645024 /NCGR_PEP_ID=MMETSP0308-20130426/1591_1 /TAXON_ID=38269 /ORGANISM="Gloeochaete witrockiana, Strain SAG 46.84" /LENGTH=383 /DNA_ID=CAMNT_0027073807 /DNA_START=246 /DNA_END=1397 /DNA_ORIENTATION=+
MVLDRVKDALMHKTIDKTFLYNWSWEDPRIDHRVLNIDSNDVVLTICSAGDNVLDYLLEGPKKIYAVDLNPAQLAVLDLKMACIANLTSDEFWRVYAEGDSQFLWDSYEKRLRSKLRLDGSREFWDASITAVNPFMYAGCSGRLAWFLVNWVLPFVAGRDSAEVLASSGPSQNMSRRARMGIKMILKILCPIAHWAGGVPSAQWALAKEREVMLGIFNRIFSSPSLAEDNYFYKGYLTGKFTKDCCPRYFLPENLAILRERLDQINLYHGTFINFIRDEKQRAPGEKITVASLLDHMDWMDDGMITEEIKELLNSMDQNKGRLLWRTFATEVHSPCLEVLDPERVDDTDCRVCMYQSTFLAKSSPKALAALRIYEQKIKEAML